MSCTVRRGSVEDLKAIAAIQEVSSDAAHWDPNDYLHYDLVVAESGSRVAGFIVTRAVAGNECELLNIAVHPEFRRLGIGTALLAHVLRSTSGEWFLEVRESNRGAIVFYEMHGFEKVGSRPDYYAGPVENAVVMRKRS